MCLIRQMRLFCLMIFVFTLLPNFYLQLFGVVYSGLFSFSTISQDEQSHWDVLAGMMPYSVRDLVVSKYLLGWGGVLIAGTLAVLGESAQRGFLPEAARPEGVLIELCIALFSIAISPALPVPLRLHPGAADYDDGAHCGGLRQRRGAGGADADRAAGTGCPAG